ncbi:MAG TPA: glutathione S-transferase family protein [Sphingomonadaceae bacterium]|nr:glutathione S-transferase family protein [Sphingomonadaceae bacterium]
MPDLVLYTNPMSRGRIARWMLEEIGEPYEVVNLDYGTTMKAPDYLAINPMGKVPALMHGETIVTEGAAICTYLGDAFPERQLAPTLQDPRRGAYLRWMFFGAGPVEAAVTNGHMKWEASEDQQAMLGYGSLSQVLGTLEHLVGAAPYLLGDRFSALDVYLGSQIIWGTQFGTMEMRPGFEDYVARVTARHAYHKAKSLDDAALPQPKETA